MGRRSVKRGYNIKMECYRCGKKIKKKECCRKINKKRTLYFCSEECTNKGWDL